MYARVVTFKGQPNKFQEGLKKLQDSIPSLRKFSGFQDLYCLTDKNTGNCIVVALWDSEQSLRNASNGVTPIRNDVNKAFGSTQDPHVEVYEVGYGPGVQQRLRRAA